MSTRKDGAVLRQIRTLFNTGAIRELTDGQLLERFATDRGEAAELAFAALVERHGPMVLRVCRGVLPDSHDAQDAFQATFLVLVRKARVLWVSDSLGPWLHQVACRTARCARRAADRRRRHERRAAEMAAAVLSGFEDRAGRDLEHALHEEIDRLPGRFRMPIVLCDLEGSSHEQAARNLGWPIGTVKSRLSRGRDRLRDRLRRRGLAPDTALVDVAPTPVRPDATIPPALADSTSGVALQTIATRALVPGPAASLAKGVLRSMSMTRWLRVTSVLLAVGATTSGALILARKGEAGAQPPPEAKPEARRGDDMPVFEVKPGKFGLTVVERGVVEAAREKIVTCRVEGSTTILSILPEGTIVEKGQLVAELDTTPLKGRLASQEITTKKAEDNYRIARYARALAEKEKKAEVERTREDELAKLATWQAEKDKEAKIREQMEGCKLLAPADGMVIHANDPSRFGAQDRLQIAEGATVRERQIIFKIPDLSEYVAKIMVHESVVDRLKLGQRARLWIEAFPRQTRTGAVERVAPLPDPSTFFSRDKMKVYTTRITIEGDPTTLRPGMAAQAAIAVVERDDVLGVPIRAVLQRDGKDRVAVKRGDGGFEWREVTLGEVGDTLIEVKQGLKAGEVVALRPLAAMRESGTRQEPGPTTQPSAKPDAPR